jgi:hypothetical protein
VGKDVGGGGAVRSFWVFSDAAQVGMRVVGFDIATLKK